ncbi:MAG TPA: hypothetical protein VGC76_14165 [Pyrinomonadaceae bacterium]|jgi:hypothetical protein
MKQSISSAFTFYFKVILPALWIPFFGVGAIVSSFNMTTSDLPFGRFFPLLMWLGGSIFIYWAGVGLKKVSIDETTLYVSNYSKEILIPRAEIQAVTENFWINTHPVTIHLKSPSPFGSKIKFMPKLRFFAFFRSHPIVEELIKSPGWRN